MQLTEYQLDLIQAPITGKVFLEGPAGAGKTTVGVERMLQLMVQGVRADSILVMLPQRNLAQPYFQALRNPGLVAGGVVDVLTLGGLAQKMVALFWPLVADKAGFAYPERGPTFLNLETAQYFMARIVEPLIEQGKFNSVTIDRNRLYSQVVDNLNKAAVVGFSHTELGERLQGAWIGDPSQAHLYSDAQEAAVKFRDYCLANNLLDFSLRVEVFLNQVWSVPVGRDYLAKTYHHLIFDNLEEDTPATHDLISAWLPQLDSAFLNYDWDGGYRIFLGADPHSGYQIKDQCQTQVEFPESLVTSPGLQTLAAGLEASFNRVAVKADSPFVSPGQPVLKEPSDVDVRAVLQFENHHFHPEMLDWVADQVVFLVKEEGVAAEEIVILAPFMSDALRYSLNERLSRRGISTQSHRPSRALREEPAAQCLLTLAAIAHPDWGILPARFDLAYALVQAIEGLDLVRAQLLAEIVYRPRQGAFELTSFDRINPDMQERLTYQLGERYENLRLWLQTYTLNPADELDHFLSRLFGELLSQPGYGFHHHRDAGQIAANLIDSARRFRWIVTENLTENQQTLGAQYVQLVQQGVVAAQYIRSWSARTPGAVFLAPAYTFLMSNRPVDYQFWLDVGGHGWAERLYQPLTQPYVLSRRWPKGAPWTDQEEFASNQEALYRLAVGLIHRCRKSIFLGLSDLGEGGYEMKGPFLKAIQRVLQNYPSRSTDVEIERLP
ncbi:MAG TPA: DEAD/DEAH box helicase family protein [Anaerolineales bacterium]|nr:DEAD/DEAH box helicase family protein [Anaerolineales bacterium]